MNEQIEMSVDTQNIFVQIIQETNTPSIPMALQIIAGRLKNIAQRAIEMKDKQIIHELKLLGIVKEKPEPSDV